MAIGKTNAIIGSAENPYIAKTEAEMAKYVADSKKVGSFVQYTGTSGTYVQNEVYRILESGDTTQYMPVSELQNITTLKKLLDATKSAYYLFYRYKGNTVNGLITYNDTSNVTNMSNMFSDCSSLISIPQLDTSNVTNMRSMFYHCTVFANIPQLDTSNVTDMAYMFNNCPWLTSIPQLDTSNVTDMRSMFSGCFRLKSILMTGMKTSFNISVSTQFETSDLVTILNNLATITSTETLTMGSTNLAKLTDEEKAIATNKGWTLAQEE